MNKVKMMLAVFVLAGPGLAVAAEVKVGGLLFGQYRHYFSEYSTTGLQVKDSEDLSIPRIYLGADVKYSETLKAKILLEGNTITAPVSISPTGATPSNQIFIKNAYGEFVDLLPGSSLQAGLIPLPWIGNEEKVWGRRYVQKVFTDIEGYVNAADSGAGLAGKVPGGYGDYHLAYVNGEGVKAMEKAGADGQYKDALGRLSLIPLPEADLFKGFKILGFYQLGQTATGEAQRRDRSVAGASFESGLFTAMATYLWASTGDKASQKNLRAEGASAFAVVNLPLDLAVFGRYDWLDPSRDDDVDTSYYRVIYGLDWKVAEGVKVALSNQVTCPAVEAANRRGENQLMVNTVFSF